LGPYKKEQLAQATLFHHRRYSLSGHSQPGDFASSRIELP
jgi:hypothetical protein